MLSMPVAPNSREQSIARMQQKLAMKRKQEKDKNLNVCGFCKIMYRDDFGNCMCGRDLLGGGHVVNRPFDESCKKWSPREGFQPPVFRSKGENEKFARKVRALSVASKTGYVNPLSFL